VELLVVDAVEDSSQSVLARRQEAIQPLAILARGDLLGVALADGVDQISAVDALGHQIEPSIPSWVERHGIDPGGVLLLWVEAALIRKVVNRQQGGRPLHG